MILRIKLGVITMNVCSKILESKSYLSIFCFIVSQTAHILNFLSLDTQGTGLAACPTTVLKSAWAFTT